MALGHDQEGFLASESEAAEESRDEAAQESRDQIHLDLKKIIGTLTTGLSKSATPNEPTPGIPGVVATPQTGGSIANSKRDPQTATLVERAIAAVRTAREATRRPPAVPTGRNKAPQDTPGGQAETHAMTPALRGVADRIAGAIKESGSGAAEIDPTIKAFKEVAQPMGRGYGLLTGGSKEKRQEGWLRRIWTSLTGFRKEETTFNKAANKILKAIEEKPEESDKGSHGLLGALTAGLGGMLMRLPVIGPLLKGAGMALGLGGKGAGMAGKAGEAVAGGAKEAGLLGKTCLIDGSPTLSPAALRCETPLPRLTRKEYDHEHQ